jgi:hypothetical protein
MNKHEVHTHVIDTYLPGESLVIMEVGRVRVADPTAKLVDGWSTLAYLNHPKRIQVVSCDTDFNTRMVCREVIDRHGNLNASKNLGLLEFHDELPNDIRCDLLFLDTDNDAVQVWELYLECVERRDVVGKSLILVDDVLSPEGRKGDIIVPALMSKYEVIELNPYVLLKPR